MHNEPSKPPLGPSTTASQAPATSNLEGPTAQLSYVLAERNKRVRSLWANTTEALSARSWLTELCALSEAAIKQHHIGLISYQQGKSGQTSAKALCVPVPDKNGPEFAPCLAAEKPGAKRRGQYVMLAIPGLTTKTEPAQWKRGPKLTMFVTSRNGEQFGSVLVGFGCDLLGTNVGAGWRGAIYRHCEH